MYNHYLKNNWMEETRQHYAIKHQLRAAYSRDFTANKTGNSTAFLTWAKFEKREARQSVD